MPRRRRRATANRVLTVLKAALNYARAAGKVQTDAAWEQVKPFKGADMPKVRYLSEAEYVRLLNACPDDLRCLVTGALMTGMRYGEIARLRVADFDADGGFVTVAMSKGGKARVVALPEDGQAFFKQITAGQPAGALIFARDGGSAWGKSYQCRPLKEACANAKITPAASFHILRHTYASRLAMNGMPMPVIAAQLGHEGTRMTERHYAHLGPSYVADMVRLLFGKTSIVVPSNVVPLPVRSAG